MNILISKALTGLTLAATMSLASGVTTLANADPVPEGASNSSFSTSRVGYPLSKPGNGFIHRSHGTEQIASDTSPWRITAGSLRTSGYRKPGNGIIHRSHGTQQINSDNSPWRITKGSLRTSIYQKPGNGFIHRGGNIQRAEVAASRGKAD